MKKLIFILVGFSFLCYFGCVKGTPSTQACTNTLPYSDSTTLLKFAGVYYINTTFDSSGIYYQILDSGSGVKPNENSYCTVNYIGRLMNYVIFDSASNSRMGGYKISQLLPFWQFGLPKIGVGGHIKLLVPSAYAFGCNGYNTIPANAPLYYDITLLKVE
jgi:FKBP-type peptidyl-prolyl cis-trans isomerase FkpA